MHHRLLAHMFPFPGEKGKKYKGKEVLDILKELFTEEEAVLASNLSFAPEDVKTIARRVGKKVEEIVPILDKMAKKGLIYTDEKKSVRRYCLLLLVPGMMELQFMKGEESPGKVRLARLFDDFFEMMGADFYDVDTPLPRVLPVESKIPPVLVLPYEKASQYINDSSYIAVSICYCRHQAKLLGKGCKRPLDVCMTFGPFAEFAVKHGFGRKVSTKEALEVIDRCEEAGLVHLTENCQEKITFICNCCGCCCGFMRGITKYDKPNSIASSNFLCAVDEGSCSGCELCIERCYVKALSMSGGIAKVDTNRCIGCGLCSVVCPTDSMSLVRKKKVSTPKKDSKELRNTVMMETVARMSRK